MVPPLLHRIRFSCLETPWLPVPSCPTAQCLCRTAKSGTGAGMYHVTSRHRRPMPKKLARNRQPATVGNGCSCYQPQTQGVVSAVTAISVHALSVSSRMAQPSSLMSPMSRFCHRSSAVVSVCCNDGCVARKEETKPGEHALAMQQHIHSS